MCSDSILYQRSRQNNGFLVGKIITGSFALGAYLQTDILGVVKIMSKPSANASGFDYILAPPTLEGFDISTQTLRLGFNCAVLCKHHL
jgi:hypothetical protein